MYCLSFRDNEVILVLQPNISFDYISVTLEKETYTPACWLLLGEKRNEAYFTAHSLDVSLDKNVS